MTTEVFTTWTTTLTNLITDIGKVITGLLSWANTFLTFIIDNPVILIPVLFGFIAFVVITIRGFMHH